MAEKLKSDSWLWVIVMDPEAKPQYLGQQQEGADVAFIPTFRSKEDAQQGLASMSLEKGRKIEIQAIMFDHLCEDAAANGFHLFIIDAEGNVVEKIAPDISP